MQRSILMLEHDNDDRYVTQAAFDENIQKPYTRVQTTEKISAFVRYWFETVELPWAKEAFG